MALASVGQVHPSQPGADQSSQRLACPTCWEQLFKPQSFQAFLDSEWFNFSTTLKDLRTSAALGCGLCQCIQKSVENWDTQDYKPYGDADVLAIALSHLPVSSSSPRYDINWLWLVVDGTCLDQLLVYPAPDSISAKYLTTRTINSDTASVASYALAKSWLRECLDSHDMCPSYQMKALPTRVIDVFPENGTINIVKLRVSRGIKASYIALSYCWGDAGQQENTTNSQNFELKLSGFDIRTLPKTICDAVLATRQLGIKFLWVDSQCIIQDSEEDKRQEISQMRLIYTNAYCTIIAESAISASAGFLAPRPLPSGPEYRLPYPCPDFQTGTMCLRSQMSYFYEPRKEPINKRAWTFEERFLSQRKLIYTSKYLRWQCQSREHVDGGSSSSRFLEASLRPLTQLLHPASERTVENIPKRNTELLSLWKQITEEYTDRELTKVKDKLRAIAGIADAFQQVWPADERYLAGLWSSHLFVLLAWRKDEKTLKERPLVYRSPSWSWASVDGKVYYGLDAKHDSEFFEILACNVSLKSTSVPLLDVTGGELRTFGFLKETSFAYSSHHKTHVIFDVDDDLGYDDLGWAFVDSVNDKSLTRVWCLAMSQGYFENTEVESEGPSGMILAPANGNGMFRRVGFFRLWEKWALEWFMLNNEKQTVIII